MSHVCCDITRTIGRTPLVGLRRVVGDSAARILAKLEFFNPLSSVKDRIGLAMIEAAEAEGRLGPDSLLVEPTSGNTGIALAFVASARGYRLCLTMPRGMSGERIALLRALGAQVELTDDPWSMQAAVDRARELVEATPGAVMLGQFDNPANPAAHRRTTGPEIWEDTEGAVDIFVAGVGTGGTVSGVGSYLKSQNPRVKVFAVEPSECPVLAGGPPGPHGIQGIGAGFIPENLDRSVLDGLVHVSTAEAKAMSRRLAREEGIFVGVSSGANTVAALKVAARPEFRNKTIVTVHCSGGERYLSTDLFADAEAAAR